MTKKLNTFCNSNVVFRNLIDLSNSWYSSSSYKQASEIYGISITPLKVLAAINEEPILWLETSINPFSTGSSLCHVDQSEYLNSTEYLMVYTANRGVGITQLNQLFPSGPVGPKLQKIMAGLGYKVHLADITTMRPDLYYWSPPVGLVGSSSNPNPSLTVDTDGPARSPNSTSSSSSSTLSASSTSKTASSASTCTTMSNYWLLLFLCIIIFF
jgi:hypothetical protein